METVALIQDNEGKFNLNYSEGVLVREDSEISFTKHNLLCFGRLDNNLTKNPTLRNGSASAVLESRLIYSTSWSYYMEGDISLEAMKRIIVDFNTACDRDYKAGLFEERIVLKNITKIDSNSILLRVRIGAQDQEFTINI